MEDRDDYPIIPQPEKRREGNSDRYIPTTETDPSKVLASLREKLRASNKELASLKEENAKLKFRADLVSIYKQEKEDRDKILHQIKCTLYDRLTETEKLNDILKFFPTALKTFSDNK